MLCWLMQQTVSSAPVTRNSLVSRTKLQRSLRLVNPINGRRVQPSMLDRRDDNLLTTTERRALKRLRLSTQRKCCTLFAANQTVLSERNLVCYYIFITAASIASKARSSADFVDAREKLRCKARKSKLWQLHSTHRMDDTFRSSFH